ncbi:replicative helicase loader/inhibitor [Paenibacillus sp. 11B]|uniref:replicative helicase loader/inhibitor n=1 Tax=Paenibacillus sp. 11B TaxID=3060965 RepID=UPI0026515AA2|nr:replicative helicase loader/inhibitor [Paenibacillus sp. 11B]MDN8592058.1 replicative helicase loader/inhibitor [Paenibacillus sp. 11B]
MDRAEIFDLLIEIKENYPHFDVSEENVDRHMKYLHDFSFEAAQQNLQEHVRTGKWPPNIAEIRGNLGDQEARQRELEATRAYLDQREANRAKATLPPAGWKDGLLAKLRNTRD